MSNAPSTAPQAHQHLKLDDLPQHARERLAGMREHQFFTSDLSVNEFLLVKEAGFQPLGLVMGSSIYHVGFQPMRSGVSEELTCSRRRSTARASWPWRAGGGGRRAGRRRRRGGAADAQRARVGRQRDRVSGHRHGGQEPERARFRGPERRPFTSDLSGQDFWTLLNAGYRPVGFVMGNCVYYVGQGVPGAQPTQNQELVGATQALLRRARAGDGAHAGRGRGAGAAGIVGVIVDENNHTWGPNVLEFSAVGTAVVPIRDDHHIARPALVLTVGD